jgi:hypothetical protein
LDELERYDQPNPIDGDSYPKPPFETIREAWQVAYSLFDSQTPTPSVVPAEEGGVDLSGTSTVGI